MLVGMQMTICMHFYELLRYLATLIIKSKKKEVLIESDTTEQHVLYIVCIINGCELKLFIPVSIQISKSIHYQTLSLHFYASRP